MTSKKAGLLLIFVGLCLLLHPLGILAMLVSYYQYGSIFGDSVEDVFLVLSVPFLIVGLILILLKPNGVRPLD